MNDNGSGSAYGVFLDLGAILDIKNMFSIGLSAQNLGFSSYEKSPISLRSGAGIRLLNDEFNCLNFAFDLRYGADKIVEAAAGFEYSFASSLYLRGGYKLESNYETTEGEISGLNTGIGIKINSVTINYSVAFNGGLGTTHTVSLKIIRIPEL